MIDTLTNLVRLPEDDMKYRFDIYFPGDESAGMRSYSNEVTVEFSDDPGGEPGDFYAHIVASLQDWFDGANITTLQIS